RALLPVLASALVDARSRIRRRTPDRTPPRVPRRAAVLAGHVRQGTLRASVERAAFPTARPTHGVQGAKGVTPWAPRARRRSISASYAVTTGTAERSQV